MQNLTLQRAEDRGKTQIDWLESYHSFSFGDYYDPNNMGFSDLRVINDDIIASARGFNTHSHQDMEIITYVLQGEIAHKDSLGNGSVIHAGDVQRMSAGTGVRHSEFNNSSTEAAHLLQIWILPAQNGAEPGYEQIAFHPDEKRNRWCVLASPDGRDGSVTVHQDVTLMSTLLSAGEERAYTVASNRSAWIHVASGTVQWGAHTLHAGDSVGVTVPQTVTLKGDVENSEILLFDLRPVR